MSNTLGRHVLVEFYGCSSEILNDVFKIEQSMVQAAKEAEATVINSTFHHFSPYGVSGVVVIQESHLAIHAWPEYQYAAVDLFTCGTEVNPWIAYDYLKKAFKAEHGSAMEINRGQIDLLQRVNVDYLIQDRAETEEELNPQFKRDVWFTDRDDNIALSLRHTGELLYEAESEYQKVRILNSYAYGKMLSIDNMVMATEKDEFVYHEMITHVPYYLHQNPKKVLVIGGGDGGTIRELFKHEGIEKVTMVEIDANVIEASKLHLPSLSCDFDNPRLELLITDGIKYLDEAEDASFDMIIIDGSDPEGPAEGLFSTEFYQNAYRCLKDGGVLNLQSESPQFSSDAFLGLNSCLKNIFGKKSVGCYLAYISTYPTGMWSFHTAIKDKEFTLENLEDKRIEEFTQKVNTEYYTKDIHRAAYVLPPFVSKMIEKHNEKHVK